uniref:Uncharacterized protein n=1 Tax=Arundo donax TaxID=35708 RepID=A0A0A9BNC1_ARUDO
MFSTPRVSVLSNVLMFFILSFYSIYCLTVLYSAIRLGSS